MHGGGYARLRRGNSLRTRLSARLTGSCTTTRVVAMMIKTPPHISVGVMGCPSANTLSITALTGSRAPNIAVGVDPIN